jgi:hypothetical protein
LGKRKSLKTKTNGAKKSVKKGVLKRVFMKTFFVILGIFWFYTSLLSPLSIAKEGGSEEYVYLLKSEGGKVYRIMEQINPFDSPV